MTKPKSIAIIAHSPRTVRIALGDTSVEAGGAELQLAWTAQLLRDRDWNVSFVMPVTGEAPPTGEGSGFQVVPAHHPGRGRGPLGYLSCTVRDYWRALGQANASIYLHRGATGMAGWTALHCRLTGSHPVLSAASNLDVAPDLHGQSGEACPSRLNQTLYRYFLSRCDRVFVQSPEQAQLYRERSGKAAVEMPNIADIPALVPAKSPTPLIAWAGAIRKCKRPLWVIDMARLLPEVRFAVAGGPNPGEEPLWEQLQEAAAETPNVDLLGWLKVAEVEDLIGRAWACLCTSQMEGFPNVYLMAWGRETPLITSFPAGGLAERSGASFIGDSPAALAEAARRLVAEEPLRRKMGHTGRQYALSNHSRDAVGDRYDASLSAMLGASA
ncbi:MAG: glycosyltransferase family 4 protein [Armatimonadia bacterium]